MSGTIMSQVNEPKFKVIDPMETLRFVSMLHLLVAEVIVEGERKEAISKGFEFSLIIFLATMPLVKK
jgi:hypothetical protein